MGKPTGALTDAVSRVIVKNVPPHATETRLREAFAACGEVTDCRLKLTKAGKSRQFAFVGFRNPAEAKEAVKTLNRSFFDTARISVELAHAPGSEALARPWSQYAPGSSAHKRLQEKAATKPASDQAGQANESSAKRKEAKPQPVVPVGAKVKTAAVTPTKAGVASHRVHTEFGSDEEDEGATASASRAEEAAFDEDLDDLAYLRAKASKKVEADSAPEAGAATADSVDTAVKRKKKKKRRGSDAAEAAEAPADGAAADIDQAASKADAAPEVATAAAENGHASDSDDPQKEELETSGRLFVTNIPYGATEDELRAHFETLGEVGVVHLIRDEDTLKSRGFAYVSYVFPECALRALSELDMRSFQGRLLRVTGAKAKPLPPDSSASAPKAGGNSSYKRKLAEKQKKVDAHLEHTWNLLYVSANAAADAAAAQLGLTKGDLLGKDADNAAVTSALTETSVLQQTKRWLQREGIRVEAFEQSGASLAKCRAKGAEGGEMKRRQDSFIVKHLPAGASIEELRERFMRCGELVRCSLAPSGTVAIVQYAENAHAKRAFQKIAFSKYKHSPLYLEWAPEDTFVEGVKPPPLDATGEDAKAEAAEEEEVPEGVTSLFVKNLSFSTTDAALKAAFKACKGLRSAIIMRKKAAVNAKGGSADDSKGQSMGYGFLEFASAEDAKEAMKRKQNTEVDGHVLKLQVSQRGRQEGRAASVNSSSKKSGALPSPRLCVRNLAFEVKNAELRQLFGAYGSVTAVRIPKKANYDGHRGFAFIDFASKAEAAAAFEALQHTHLYGRRLVIEAAEEKATDVASVQQAAEKRQAQKGLKSEATKRRRTSVLTTGGPGASFEDAFMS